MATRSSGGMRFRSNEYLMKNATPRNNASPPTHAKSFAPMNCSQFTTGPGGRAGDGTGGGAKGSVNGEVSTRGFSKTYFREGAGTPDFAKTGSGGWGSRAWLSSVSSGGCHLRGACFTGSSTCATAGGAGCGGCFRSSATVEARTLTLFCSTSIFRVRSSTRRCAFLERDIATSGSTMIKTRKPSRRAIMYSIPETPRKRRSQMSVTGRTMPRSARKCEIDNFNRSSFKMMIHF